MARLISAGPATSGLSKPSPIVGILCLIELLTVTSIKLNWPKMYLKLALLTDNCRISWWRISLPLQKVVE